MKSTQQDKDTPTTSRKQQHVDVCLEEDVAFRSKSAGFERYEFEYNALPELNLAEVSTATTFLGKSLSQPLMISCMTGGYADAERINRHLAEVCESRRIAVGVGSMRQAWESSTHHRSFSIVRQAAPTIPIVANIGAAEIAHKPSVEKLRLLIDLIQADALTIHLNALQELLQPEGTPAFRGVLAGIEHTVKSLELPIIVKEVGAGISGAVARRLLDVGVRIIDVAGAGGTSWAGVEILRIADTEKRAVVEALWDFGIPTCQCLEQVAALKKEYDFCLVASGGVRSGMDAATSLALGADMVASARPFLLELEEKGQEALSQKIQAWELQLRSLMFLTGSATLAQLQNAVINKVH